MKQYCFDTSGFTNPLHSVPEDIFASLWGRIGQIVKDGRIAVTTEIFEELEGTIYSPIGGVIDASQTDLVLAVGVGDWDHAAYIQENARIISTYRQFISEYMPGIPDNTVCLNDITIITLAKVTGLPLVSMETSTGNSLKYKRIPDICVQEHIVHLTFLEFLRREGIKV